MSAHALTFRPKPLAEARAAHFRARYDWDHGTQYRESGLVTVPRFLRFGKPGHFFDTDQDNMHRARTAEQVLRVHSWGLRIFRGLRGEDGAASIANIAKGRFNEYMIRVDGNDPTNSAFVIDLLVDGHEALATLQDYDDLAALLVPAANTKCAFTNYARVNQTDTDVSGPTIDDTGNDQGFTFTDDSPAISSAGNATNETIGGAVIGYDSDTTGGTDANIIPIHLEDFASTLTTNGSDINYDYPAADLLLAA